MSETKTTFAKQLEQRGVHLKNELLAKIAEAVNTVVRGHASDLPLGQFPFLEISYSSDSYSRGFQVRVSPGHNGHNEKNANEMFEKLAFDRFEKSLENIRWAIENQGGQQ
jgi:hypothetical protein